MAEIRLDVRLTRPGALVAAVADGRAALVRVLRDAAGAEPWVAAHAAGLPVPAVAATRCAGRPALVVEPVAGEPLTAATPVAVRAQADGLARALAGHGIAAGCLRARDLAVVGGALVVRVPVEGAAGDPAAEAAALVATVEEACASAPERAGRRRPRRSQALLVTICAALALVLGLAHGPGSPAHAPRTPAAQAAPLPLPSPGLAAPSPAPAVAVASPKAARRPPRARTHRPRRRHHSTHRRRPRRASAPVVPRPRLRPATPVRPRHRSPGGIAPAGGYAEPLPVL
jgi:hypothetical protein